MSQFTVKIGRIVLVPINTLQKIDSCDYWRAGAILSVVLFHAEFFPYGYLGVDLFFVLSGFLVSQSLLKQIKENGLISFTPFFISRAFKIWPMYFSFLLLGNFAAYLLYRYSHPDQFIPLEHMAKYLLFYQNYRGTVHYSFDHIWSLCVEEHFYLLLPLGLALLCLFKQTSYKKIALSLMIMIVLGNCARSLGYLIQFETYSATHNRIDALCWGVLLSLIKQYELLPRWKHASAIIFCTGLLLFTSTITMHYLNISPYLNKVAFYGMMPASFFLLILGSINFSSPHLKVLQFISKYSYGWYLWHMLLYYFTKDTFGFGVMGTLFFVVSGFMLGVISTHLIENRAMKMKALLLRYLSRKKPSNQSEPDYVSELRAA